MIFYTYSIFSSLEWSEYGRNTGSSESVVSEITWIVKHHTSIPFHRLVPDAVGNPPHNLSDAVISDPW